METRLAKYRDYSYSTLVRVLLEITPDLLNIRISGLASNLIGISENDTHPMLDRITALQLQLIKTVKLED